MIRSKFFILFLFIFPTFTLPAQVKHFNPAKAEFSAYRMKMNKGDTVIVEDDSAYIYSIGMVNKINELEHLYLSCLNLRDSDLFQIRSMMVSLKDGYSEVNSLINRSSGITKEQVNNIQQQVSNIISNLQEDITSLQQVEYNLTNARSELESVKKEIRKERSLLWWKKTGSVLIALIAGFAAGFIIASS